VLLIAVYYRRRGRNLRAKLDIVINSLSVNHAYLKTLYTRDTRHIFKNNFATSADLEDVYALLSAIQVTLITCLVMPPPLGIGIKR